jgi:2-oxoglutarate ferredoxin oxidoreductase subunit delta
MWKNKKEEVKDMGEIRVVTERCKSCGYCIKFCPKGVLTIGDKVNSKGYEYVTPSNMEACISCCICGRMCPEGAIEIYK